jgi:hypothetical protein
VARAAAALGWVAAVELVVEQAAAVRVAQRARVVLAAGKAAQPLGPKPS